MAGFTYRLELEDGTPADPPSLETAVPTWRVGDTIPLGRDTSLRVIDVRPGREDEDPVLVVETARAPRRSAASASGMNVAPESFA
jgi:hypothetical protein